MYYFQSQQHGSCRVEAKTAGKHGFGFPKIFAFTSVDPALTGVFKLQYRNTRIANDLSTPTRTNFELIMAAITQFCETKYDFENDVTEELESDNLLLSGEVNNRYGRIMSDKSFLPRRLVRA